MKKAGFIASGRFLLPLLLACAATAQTTYYVGPTNGNLTDPANWSSGLPESNPYLGIFDGQNTGSGELRLTLDADFGFRSATANTGTQLQLTGNQTNAVYITASGTSRDLNVRYGTTAIVNMLVGAGPLTLGASGENIHLIVGDGTSSKSTVFTNNSASAVTFGEHVSLYSGNNTAQAIYFRGSGTGGFNFQGNLYTGQTKVDTEIRLTGANAALTLGGDNTDMPGKFTLYNGALIIASDNALGDAEVDLRTAAGLGIKFRSDGTDRTLHNNLIFSSSLAADKQVLGGSGSGKLTFTGTANWGSAAKYHTIDSSIVEFTGTWAGDTSANSLYGTGVDQSILVLSGDRGTSSKPITIREGLTVRINHSKAFSGNTAAVVRVIGGASDSRVELSNNLSLAQNLRIEGRTHTSPALLNTSGTNTLGLILEEGGTNYSLSSTQGSMTISSVSGVTSNRDLFVAGSGNVILPNWNDRRNIAKNGAGVLTLGGSSHTGKTEVLAGGVIVQGDQSALTETLVSNGAFFGGNGALAGNLVLASGALLAFDPTWTLTLSTADNVTLASTFGVDSLKTANGAAIDWRPIANNTYTLLAGTTTDFSGIRHFGADQAYNAGGGKLVYFENNGLQLVVIPEPTTLRIVLGILGLVWGSRFLFVRKPQPDEDD